MQPQRLILLIALICATVGGPARSQEIRLAPTAIQLQKMWSRGAGAENSADKGPVRLATFPLRLEDIATIIPMGMTVSGHVTPSDHLYLMPKESPDRARQYDVVAVADGNVVNIQWRPKGNPDPTVHDREVDLKVIVEHSPTCWSYVDHLTQLDPAVSKQIDPAIKPGQPVSVRIPVKAGQPIGKVGLQTFDFALVDAATTRKGFVVAERFLDRDPWKMHTVDPFDYVEEPLKSQLLALESAEGGAARRANRLRHRWPARGKLVSGGNRRLCGHEPSARLLGRAFGVRLPSHQPQNRGHFHRRLRRRGPSVLGKGKQPRPGDNWPARWRGEVRVDVGSNGSIRPAADSSGCRHRAGSASCPGSAGPETEMRDFPQQDRLRRKRFHQRRKDLHTVMADGSAYRPPSSANRLPLPASIISVK